MNVFSKGCAVALIALGVGIQVNAEKLLIDFGDDGSYRSVGVSSPDINGNYWNGIGATNAISNAVNTANSATSIDILFTSEYGVDSYNGPAGNTDDGFGELNPGSIANTTFNDAQLGDLGVTNAVFDFVAVTPVTNLVGDVIDRSNVVFRLSDLDPTKYYEMTFFASRRYPSEGSPGNDVDECSVRYTAVGGSGAVSTDLHMGVFATHNPGAVASLVMTPSVSNDIEVVISAVTTNSLASLNAMSIEILDTAPVAPTNQVMLVDFGTAGTDPQYRSLSVPGGVDYKGDVWNQVSWQPVGNISDTSNRLTPLDLVVTTGYGVDSYNGPAGDTSGGTDGGWDWNASSVTNTSIDAVALGELGVTNAAYDFFTGTVKFELRNCDTNKIYNLTFFGSHKYDVPGTTTYEVLESGTSTSVVASVQLAHNDYSVTGLEWQHNTNRVATLTNVTASVDNTIYLQFSGYLNSMKIEMFDAPSTGPEIAPVITIFGVSGSNVSLTWTADSVGTYSIQRKTDLTAGTWTDVLTGLPAGGGTANVTASGADAEFYQIYGE